jgi:tripartite-type tricarboxylate transporter receptor subunit TctC
MKKLLSIILLTLSGLASANNTLKIIVPFAPGGNTDVTARLYAKELNNQNIDAIVVNRPGADGKVAVTEFLNAAPDGKTVLFGGNGSIVYPALENKDYYENTKRLVPVMQAAVFGSILVSRKDSSIQTLDQLFAAVKTRPVSIGVGSAVYKSLIADIFGNDPNVIVVPYGGDAPTSLALQNKTIDVAFVTFLYGPRLLNNDHTGIAVSTDTGMFGVKTFREQGVNVMRDQWIGFFAPPGTTDEQLSKLYSALEKARQSPELQDAVKNQMHSIVARSRTPKEFATYIEHDYRRLLKLMK